ncbi:MAG: hypothetical protein FWG91_11245 [Lachnospiraceae bacterium]|nr:hypothetical protein [Lachnospiraceae bacterium]
MKAVYKYSPSDFSGILGIPEELNYFYELLETYRDNKNSETWFPLRRHWEELFFLLKARGVEGNLNPVMAQEIQGYLESLVND